MIGVLTLFGDVDLQGVLKKIFMQNDLVFIAENCNTSVQLVDKVCEHYKETDVIIVAATAMNMEAFPEIVSEIRELENKMRIILILNGNSEQYLESQLAEFENKRIDVLYDDDGFDTQDLIELVKQGKLSRSKIKEKKKQADIKEQHIPESPEQNKKDEQISSDIEGKETENVLPKRKHARTVNKENKKTFSQPKGKYTIGLFNACHGAGATTASINLAKYFSLHGFVTKLVDLSATDTLSLVKIKDVKISLGTQELGDFKRESNVLIMDFGTPYHITPKGDNFMISHAYIPENIREIRKCNIKIIFGFADVWNIGKIKFFLNNEQWREMIDDSYIFLVADNAKLLKEEYPDINIMNRDDDYMDEILQVIKEAE